MNMINETPRNNFFNVDDNLAPTKR